MTAAPLHFAGERLLLDPSGALVWPEAGLLVVADLHLEKATAAAARGSLLPPWDTRITLDGLTQVLRRWKPRVLVALGDSFHDARAAGRLPAGERARLVALTSAHEVVWVAGNHDPAPPVGLGGTACSVFAHRGLVFRHQAAVVATGEVSGHFHPKARVMTRAGGVARPCFVASAQRLVLPAFGAFTGGLDVTHPALGALFPRGGRVFMLGRERLFSFPLGQAARAEPAAPPRVQQEGLLF